MTVIYRVRHTNNACRISLTVDSINILQELGFTAYPVKSCLTPKQKITFLGFEINSCSVTIVLTNDKKKRLKDYVSNCQLLTRFVKEN